MTSATKAVVVDGVLKEIGDRLFWEPIRPMKARNNIKGVRVQQKPRPIPVLRSAGQAQRTRTTLRNTVRKVPEVMVKISGGGKSVMQIKAHLDYISRNGDVPLEDEQGNLIAGREAVRDLRDEWQFGRMGLARESETKQAFNIILSMPPGTDRAAVTSAARDFAKAEFSDNYSYVFATHEDEKHPHVHIVVKALGRDGVRLNPRKADLQRWRELFAEKLRDNGIEANATKRQVRGITRKARRQQIVHMEQRGQRSRNRIGQTQAIVQELKTGESSPNPRQDKIFQTRKRVQATLQAAVTTLERSETPEDRALAGDVKKHLAGMPAPLTVRELAVEEAKDKLNRGVDRPGPGKNK